MSASTPTTSAPSDSFPTPTHPTTAPSTVYNDEERVNGGDAESSKAGEQRSLSPREMHALNFTDYVFNVGYMGQRWADVQLTFFEEGLKLHRIILARSPYLAQAMMNAGPGTTTHLQFRDETITPEAVHTCIHHLYSPAFPLVSPSNARAVLAAALHFGGMPELVHHAYIICRDSISSGNISEWVEWVSATAIPPHQANGYHVNGGSAGTGEEVWGDEGWYGRYGEYSDRIKQDIYDYLTITLPSSPPSTSADVAKPTPLAHLLTYYTPLPFPLFKRVVESPVLPFKDKQAQFAFAKKAIAARKKKAAAAGMEEAAVLAFKGEAGGAAVEITRKNKKGARPALWKVEG